MTVLETPDLLGALRLLGMTATRERHGPAVEAVAQPRAEEPREPLCSPSGRLIPASHEPGRPRGSGRHTRDEGRPWLPRPHRRRRRLRVVLAGARSRHRPARRARAHPAWPHRRPDRARHDRVVESISTGGFTLDVPFTATGLRELAKMDGAIIVDRDLSRIIRAAVHLMPDPAIPSDETGTRHRTADRVARQTGCPVISVSQSMQIIAAYVGDIRHVLEGSGPDPVPRQPGPGHPRALQAAARRGLRDPVRPGDRGPGRPCATSRSSPNGSRWSSASRARSRTTSSSSAPTAACCPSSSTSWSPASTRSASSWSATTCPRDGAPRGPEAALARLEALSSIDLVDPASASRALGLGDHLDGAVAPRGYRLLAKVPRLPGAVVERLVEHFEHTAEAALRRRRGPPDRRRCRRAAGSQRARGPVPARGVVDPRAVRLSD